MKEFFAMGGYAFFVWTAYGLAFIILLSNVLIPWRHEKKLLRENVRRQVKLRRQNVDDTT